MDHGLWVVGLKLKVAGHRLDTMQDRDSMLFLLGERRERRERTSSHNHLITTRNTCMIGKKVVASSGSLSSLTE